MLRFTAIFVMSGLLTGATGTQVKCPDGSHAVGETPPKGFQLICWKRSKNGPATYWHKNGQKKSEGEYRSDKKHGKWTYWNDEGQVTKGNYSNGIKDGAWIESTCKGNYEFGKKSGLWKCWVSVKSMSEPDNFFWTEQWKAGAIYRKVIFNLEEGHKMMQMDWAKGSIDDDPKTASTQCWDHTGQPQSCDQIRFFSDDEEEEEVP